jgi:hypothetical protein
MSANYPPLQQDPVDPRTGKLTRPWAQYFQTLQTFQHIEEPPSGDASLVGRDGSHPISIIVGDGLLLENGVLSATETHYYEPLTNGNLVAADLIYASGDVIMIARLT